MVPELNASRLPLLGGQALRRVVRMAFASSSKRDPTLTIVSITGMSSLPSSDSVYSTEGGEDGATVRVTTHFSSSSRSRAVSIFAEMPGMSLESSPKRRGPPLSCQMTLVVQAPPSSAMQAPIGHPGGGGGVLFLRSLGSMSALQESAAPAAGSPVTKRIVEFFTYGKVGTIQR